MVIIELPAFTRRVTELLPDDEYSELQSALVKRPGAGALIKGSGGLRKLRWSIPGRGKRGGLRVIYYWAVAEDQILLLLIYTKNEQDDLSAHQLRLLKQIVQDEHG